MTDSQRTPRRATPAIATALWRAARRAAVALRAINDEQVLMWELFLQAGRVPADRAGPLAWVSSLDGPRLTGNRLLVLDEPSAEGGL